VEVVKLGLKLLESVGQKIDVGKWEDRSIIDGRKDE